MKDSPSPTGNIVTSLIFFGVTAAIAIILFIDAFVMWLAASLAFLSWLSAPA